MVAAAASRDWGRRYPPLVAIGLAIVLAVFTLPSALNLPQANPGQVAEYAPVPGQNGNPPAGGNFAGLGLGEGGSAEGGGGQAGGSLPGLSLPTSFDCVGNPPRQTEDPLSPPCVPVFNGDNGGSTWVGVTKHSFTVIFRTVVLDSGGNCFPVAESNNCGPPSGWYDMNNPSDVNTFFLWRYLRDWEIYFNTHYQTYGRQAHFYVWNFGDTAGYLQNGYTASDQKAEAVDGWNRYHPFADIDMGNAQPFNEYLAQHNVLSFGPPYTEALAAQYPGLYWGYQPARERRAMEYATYVCTKIIQPGRVTFSGNGDTGQPRKYGLLLTDDNDPSHQNTRPLQDAAVADMKRLCGFNPIDTEYFHYTGAASASGPRSGWGPINMARMKQAGVTTVIWPGGMEGEDTKAADGIQWYPEWVVLGDGATDANQNMSTIPGTESSHLWLTTPLTRLNTNGYPVEGACYSAILAVDPTIPRASDLPYACGGVNSGQLFDSVRQLFIGVQVAGPHLTPQNMNQGFHAIPAKPSTSPDLPSCYYLPGDYSCVKDAIAEWYDPTASVSSGEGSSQGCYRMWLGGFRYLPGQWPSGDANDKNAGRDPCNLYTGLGANIRPT